jgi:hypothetical protein
MLHREAITLTLLDEADRTVTVEAVRTSLRLGVWKMGAFVDYTRPVRVIDRHGDDRVEHRIPDVGAIARLLVFIAGLSGLRGRADRRGLGGLGLGPRIAQR